MIKNIQNQLNEKNQVSRVYEEKYCPNIKAIHTNIIICKIICFPKRIVSFWSSNLRKTIDISQLKTPAKNVSMIYIIEVIYIIKFGNIFMYFLLFCKKDYLRLISISSLSNQSSISWMMKSTPEFLKLYAFPRRFSLTSLKSALP